GRVNHDELAERMRDRVGGSMTAPRAAIYARVSTDDQVEKYGLASRRERRPSTIPSTQWVIDGYNVIRRDPDLRSREAQSLEAGRRGLLHLVARLARTIPQDELTVVFDGAR